MRIIRIFSVVAAALLFVSASGCRVSSVSPTKEEKKAPSKTQSTQPKLSDEEYKKIKALVRPSIVSITPNSVDFMTYYGDVTNGSNRTIREVHLVLVAMAEESGADIRPAGQIGRTIVKDLRPGKTKSFNITSSLETSESSGYEVRVEDIKL